MPRSVALYVLLVCACAVTAVLAADESLRITAFYDDLTAPAASPTKNVMMELVETTTDGGAATGGGGAATGGGGGAATGGGGGAATGGDGGAAAGGGGAATGDGGAATGGGGAATGGGGGATGGGGGAATGGGDAAAGAVSAYCATVGDKVKDRQSGATVTCAADDVMNTNKIAELTKAVDAAIAMHASRLVVTPSAATGIKFPTSDARCTHFSTNDDHKTKAITGADFALFVAASPMEKNVQAWGTWCGAAAAPTTRPEVGAVNIAPKHFTKNSTALTRLVAREILVGLGFGLYAADGYKDVTKTTVRGKTGVPAANGGAVLVAAKKHFGCDSMAGVELEYADEASKTPLPYWRGRVMKDDLMAPNQTAGYYTAITIAAMVDTGFYTGNYANAEEMPWGRKAGCDFIGKKCIGSDGKAISNMFCTGDTTQLSCTTDRLALGTCDTQAYTDELPVYFQYFADKKKGGVQISMDYCPVVAPTDTKTHCSTTGSNMPYSVFGESARCLDLQSAAGSYVDKQMHGLCADIQCNAADSTYTVKVKGATSFAECKAGGTASVSITDGTASTTVVLVCPPYNEVCVTHEPASDSSSSHPPPNDGAVMTATRSMSWVAACLVAVLLACV